MEVDNVLFQTVLDLSGDLDLFIFCKAKKTVKYEQRAYSGFAELTNFSFYQLTPLILT